MADARYTVRTNKIPYELRRMGFVAWIADASHPDGSEAGASCAWHQDVRDAERIAGALNRYTETQEALREQAEGEGMPVITWKTHKVADGFEYVVYSFGYQLPTETLKTGVVRSRARARLLGMQWAAYLKGYPHQPTIAA